VLAHVHDRGVVHRDVKPANVLLDRHRCPWLADFGLARLLDRAGDTAAGDTAAGGLVGTAAYMAPEQVRGVDVGAAADVWSLGLVLLEAVTGRREYGGGLVECAVARLHRDPRVPPTVPAPLAEVLVEMTAPHPAWRPSAAGASRALARVLAGLHRPARAA
jgi:serine/threonine protein kinase